VRLSYRLQDQRKAGDPGQPFEILGTKEHPFWSLTKHEWVAMGQLSSGDLLQLAKGEVGEVISLHSVRATDGEAYTTYNFEVEDWHTYFVAGQKENAAPTWVHNSNVCPIRLKSLQSAKRFRNSQEDLIEKAKTNFQRAKELKNQLLGKSGLYHLDVKSTTVFVGHWLTPSGLLETLVSTTGGRFTEEIAEFLKEGEIFIKGHLHAEMNPLIRGTGGRLLTAGTDMAHCNACQRGLREAGVVHGWGRTKAGLVVYGAGLRKALDIQKVTLRRFMNEHFPSYFRRLSEHVVSRKVLDLATGEEILIDSGWLLKGKHNKLERIELIEALRRHLSLK